MDQLAGLTISSNAPGARLFLLGNEAIARGAVEAGARVVAAYPGTPSTEIVETLLDHRRDLDMYAEWSINEKVAFGLAFGASLCGARGMAVMKHVGVNVALDSLMTAAYIGITGGLVLVEAEDPGQWSSQNEQDNRFIAEQAYIPMLEPSSAQEAKDMVVQAFRLSEEFGQPFMLRSATRLGHSRSDVTLGEISRTHQEFKLVKDPDKLVMLPAVARQHRRLMVARLAKIKKAVNFWPCNELKINPLAKLGIITSGVSYSYLREALAWLHLQEQISILRIGTPYPLPEELIRQFLRAADTILVVEELEPYLENHIKAIAQENEIVVKIHGKDFLPRIGEYSVRKITEALSRLTGTPSPINFAQIDKVVKEVEPLLPLRPPGMCPGCPHRASHFIIQTVSERIKRQTGVEPIRPGDIGCNCLGTNPPLNAIDISTCMGGGFDLSNGLARVLKGPIIANLGDSTFFHSGIPPMINAVYNKARITMIVLDNQTTAMTGSQPSPVSGYNSNGDGVPSILPEEIAKACGIQFVEVLDPQELEKGIQVLEAAVKFDGPSFIVFRRPCAILDQREKRARGEKIIPYTIEPEKCIAGSPPFCTATCPLHIDVRGYVRLVGEGKYDAALRLIQQKLPFPGILGRICTHPCESKCKRGEVDESIAIETLKRTAADNGKISDDDLTIAAERKEKVAIVGGGPAGLMAAYDLRKQGYQVTIFEALPALGGMLAFGIPEYRLPREVSRNEIDRILKMGIQVRLNTRVGIDIKLSELKVRYNAVFIALGAHQGRGLGVRNSQANGVVKGVEFLRDINLDRKVEVKGRVIVVGGGNVAIDCARSCVRLGFKEVNILYRRSRTEMPAISREVQEAENEGVKFTFLAAPVEVITGDEKVTGIKCIRMKLGIPDASGRRRPVPVQGSEFIIETDLIISAVGEQPDLSFLNQDKIFLTVKDNLLEADPVTLATATPAVFAGGDVVTGPAAVIDALAAGRKAAVSIDRYLKGEVLETGRESEGTQVSPLVVKTEGIDRKPRVGSPVLPVKLRMYNMSEVELGFTREQAREEASRCLSCGCQICSKTLGCPAIIVDGDEVTIDSSQCPGCGLCAQVCPVEAISV